VFTINNIYSLLLTTNMCIMLKNLETFFTIYEKHIASKIKLFAI